MKAVVQHKYGSPDTLELADIERPVPADDQVLIEVRAASVNPADWHTMRGEPYLIRLMGPALRAPKVVVRGMDVAGTVVAAGSEVSRLAVGDEVFGEISGSLAEFAAGYGRHLAVKPSNVTFEEAAAVPIAGLTALQALRDKAEVQPGDRVLINGASGGVGTYAVQIATAFGARVTGVCSTKNVDLVRSIGAEQVVDYMQADFTLQDVRYDSIVDTVGNHPLRKIRAVLEPDGTYVGVGSVDMGNWIGPVVGLAKTALVSRFGRPTMKSMLARPNADDLEVLAALMQDGEVRSVIDRTYPLAETAEAIRYLEEGHVPGKVVVTI